MEAGYIIKSSKDILAINLKYYRYKLSLSQEKFAEAIDTNLLYEYQLENGKRNPSLKMLDKISQNISKILGYTVSSSELILYDKNKIINANRIDGRKNK